jgi:hypothetical protein
MSDDPHDRLLLQIRGAVAEYERTLIGDRMRRGRQMKYRAGVLLPWTRPPYGYRLNPDRPRDPSGLTIDAAEAAIIREIYTWYAEEHSSLHGLAQHLQGQGVATPSGKQIWSLCTLCTHFAPSGFMGDIEDITLDPRWSDAPYRGATALRVGYSAQASREKGWGGVYWQEPENNWGTLPGGIDLSWANKLTFHAKGAYSGEHVQFFVGGIGTAPGLAIEIA